MDSKGMRGALSCGGGAGETFAVVRLSVTYCRGKPVDTWPFSRSMTILSACEMTAAPALEFTTVGTCAVHATARLS